MSGCFLTRLGKSLALLRWATAGGGLPLRFGSVFDVVDVADTVDGSERVEGEVVAFVEVADFDDILIERSATHVGMDAPD